MAARVSGNRQLSWMFAPLTASDSGTPRPSTRRLHLRPFFPLVGGVGTHRLLRCRSFVLGSVDALPAPGYAFHLVVLGQPGPPYLKEKTCLLPALEMSVHCAGGTKFPGQSLPLASGAEHIHDRREDLPRRHGLSTGARLTLVLAVRLTNTRWNKRLDLAPQLIRYRPRLDLCHVGLHLHPVSLVSITRIHRRNLSRYYLRISSQSCRLNQIECVGFSP